MILFVDLFTDYSVFGWNVELCFVLLSLYSSGDILLLILISWVLIHAGENQLKAIKDIKVVAVRKLNFDRGDGSAKSNDTVIISLL